MHTKISNPHIKDEFEIPCSKPVLISVVAYEHPAGIPARFLTGFIPAISLSRQLAEHGIKSTVRIIDPTPIANFCNGWENGQTKFEKIVTHFLKENQVEFFFDKSEAVGPEALELLEKVGLEIKTSSDPQITNLVQRIQESGKKHGNENGFDNSSVYLAAHPFSWNDLYHSSIWKKEPSCDETHINLMSRAEERFTVVRKFVREHRKDLCTKIEPIERYMTVCNTPCYIPLEDEPTSEDFQKKGADWCANRYAELKKRSRNYERIAKDFQTLLPYPGLDGYN